MSHSNTVKKLGVIGVTLVLTATASVGHAQQKWMEEVLERTLQEQRLAEETEKKETESETARETDKPKNSAPEEIDVSNTYDADGDPII